MALSVTTCFFQFFSSSSSSFVGGLMITPVSWCLRKACNIMWNVRTLTEITPRKKNAEGCCVRIKRKWRVKSDFFLVLCALQEIRLMFLAFAVEVCNSEATRVIMPSSVAYFKEEEEEEVRLYIWIIESAERSPTWWRIRAPSASEKAHWETEQSWWSHSAIYWP